MIWSLAMSRVKPFSSELLKTILNSVDESIKNAPNTPHYAAFDADGTLWDSDVGENFFQYKIDNCNLPALQGISDPWEYYFTMKKKHPPDAYLWLAQICSPFPIEEVEGWALEATKKFPLAVLEPQVQLISELKARNIEVFCVSASVQWAVAAAMPLVGLKKENGIGVVTKVENGLVGKESGGPITWREGKAQALLQRTKNVLPLFCSGNSSGDIHLLELARSQALAVQTQLNDSTHANLLEDEQKLFALAKEKSWLTHSFF